MTVIREVACVGSCRNEAKYSCKFNWSTTQHTFKHPDGTKSNRHRTFALVKESSSSHMYKRYTSPRRIELWPLWMPNGCWVNYTEGSNVTVVWIIALLQMGNLHFLSNSQISSILHGACGLLHMFTIKKNKKNTHKPVFTLNLKWCMNSPSLAGHSRKEQNKQTNEK